MNTGLRRGCFVLIALLGLTRLCAGADAKDNSFESIAELLSSLRELTQVPAFSVAIIQNGQVLAQSTVGQVDIRSDVYTLGVLAYELLAGRHPHQVRDKSIPETVRIISEEDPTPLGSVQRVLRGDLETIVAKALEKDKSRRYPSASDLVGDVRRYLENEPIAARPATTWYQLRKFVRRNRALVGAVYNLIPLYSIPALSG